jgi:uridylate kinase
MYKRILLKLSGEQLAGKFDSGIDSELGHWLANEIGEVVGSGTQVVIMVGGGNYARGAQLAGHGISRVTADNVGMLATMMNAIALADIFNASVISARALTNIKADQVVIVAGGIGRPYLTTDTAAVSLALELDCEAVLKATKVDGVYDKDPQKFDDAVKVDTVTFDEAVSNGYLKVMDKAALGLAMEHKLPMVIFNALTEHSIAQVAAGEAVGTRISE